MDKVIQRVKSTIEKHGMIQRGTTVCAAVSGGPDSTAMLAILAELKDEMGFKLNACHYDHAFRPESVEDARFAKRVADGMGLEIVTERNPSGKPRTGAQEKGRELRYSFFENLLSSGFADVVATGHTLDDSVETSIMWMLRGAGPSGFGGVQAVRGHFIRPLIETRKSGILTWLKQKGISYIEDPSNVSDDYLRNRVRRHIIPTLEKEAEGAVEAIARLTKITQAQEEVVDSLARRFIEKASSSFMKDSVALDPWLIAREPEALRWSIYRESLRITGLNPSRLCLSHIESVDNILMSSAMGKEIVLPEGFIARLDHGGLTLGRKVDMPYMEEKPFCCPLDVSLPLGSLAIAEGRSGENGEVADLSRIPENATFRTRRPGDYLRLKNLKGRKKLKTFLIDRKTPSGTRDAMPLLAVGEEILWVPGLFLSPSITAEPDTKREVTLKWII